MSAVLRSATFPKTARLLKHADFQRVYDQGRRHFASHLTAFFLGRADAAPSRVGFTVSRAMGGAVTRNRIRRRLREAVRLNRAALPHGFDVVINPKRSSEGAEFSELLAQVGRAFQVIARSAEPG